MKKKLLIPILSLLLCGCRGAPEKPKQEEYPIEESEVGFNNGNISLAGTLAVPESEGRFPAVVLISGTGANSRDEEVAGFKVFKTLSDQLVPKGIVVLRYDDRGVGGSSGSVIESTTKDFAKDVIAAVDTLKNNPKVDPNRIGLIGHDEGGWVAALAAEESKNVDFVVMMGTPAMKGEDLLLDQQRTMLKSAGMDEEAIEQKTETQKKIFDAIKNKGNWNEIKQDIKQEVQKAVDQLPEAQQQNIPNVEQFVDNTAEEVVKQIRTPWFTYFVGYDPTIALKKLNVPTLIIFGAKDIQVPAEKNVKIVDTELKGNRCITVEVVPEANHLFEKAETGSPMEYMKLEKAFAPGFVDRISNWILNDLKSCKK